MLNVECNHAICHGWYFLKVKFVCFQILMGLVPVHQLMVILFPTFQTHVSVEFCNQIILTSKFLEFNFGSHPGISHGWYSPNRSSYQTTAYNSHFPLTSASITSGADSETHGNFFSFLLLGNILMLFIDFPTTNTVDPTVMEGAEGSPKTFLNLDTPKSHNSSKYTVILKKVFI